MTTGILHGPGKARLLSDTSAQREFGLTRQEIFEAVRCGKLQYRENNIYGNPYLRLIRREVEALVKEKYGVEYLKKNKLKKEMAKVKRALKALKARAASLEKRKAQRPSRLGE